MAMHFSYKEEYTRFDFLQDHQIMKEIKRYRFFRIKRSPISFNCRRLLWRKMEWFKHTPKGRITRSFRRGFR